MLLNRFKVLKRDHQSNSKVCKHCILVHKKSHSMLNVFVGHPGKSDYLVGTPFENLSETSLFFKQPVSQGLIIRLVHSLDRPEHKLVQPLIDLPFFSITRDQGFFKDNLMVHCAETKNLRPGGKFIEDQAAIIKLKPLMKTIDGPIDYFDEKFWRYFKQFEKFLKSNESEDSFEMPNIPLSKIDRLASSKAFRFGGMGESHGLSKEPQIYILFARKNVLKKGLLRHFQVSGGEQFANFTTLKLNKLILEFNSLRSILTWRSVRSNLREKFNFHIDP